MFVHRLALDSSHSVYFDSDSYDEQETKELSKVLTI